MNIGKLDRRVIVETFTAAKDQYGQEVRTWDADSTRWAHFEARVSPSAAFGDTDVMEQPVMRSVAIFTFRNTPPVFDGEFRLDFNGRKWNPVQVASKGTRGEWTTVVAEAFNNDANG
jgi:head-tail adaptor